MRVLVRVRVRLQTPSSTRSHDRPTDGGQPRDAKRLTEMDKDRTGHVPVMDCSMKLHLHARRSLSCAPVAGTSCACSKFEHRAPCPRTRSLDAHAKLASRCQHQASTSNSDGVDCVALHPSWCLEQILAAFPASTLDARHSTLSTPQRLIPLTHSHSRIRV
ncbi:hypothetical protein BDZ90DRAFT_154967 [Jaminaea rosea]|uniref:Uncharacterized protein n=1 Tax=Jaminaea rosea TaxID=1569628 RepID=A0A316UTU1_9BASI|nr:hypothetical protein BDZ90DRAFT_154967 [Jaminaea rosea]PWN28682.1 hypothetical protein BDZ90DRAFT_154967 [Jaminaea rosea]